MFSFNCDHLVDISFFSDNNSPLDVLADDVASIVLEYANDINATFSANSIVQKKYTSIFTKLIKENENLFMRNSIILKENESSFTEVMDLCNKRLEQIHGALDFAGYDLIEREDYFHRELGQLHENQTLIIQAKTSTNIIEKISALRNSIHFLNRISVEHQINHHSDEGVLAYEKWQKPGVLNEGNSGME